MGQSGVGEVRVGAAAVVTLGILVLVGTFTVEAANRSFGVEMKNLQFALGEIRVDWGDEVTIHVHNNDTGVPHTFEIVEYDIHLGTRNNPVPPGAQDSTTFTANQNGTFWYFCSVLGHSLRLADGSYTGMAGRLIVGVEEPDDGPDIPFLIIGIVAAAVAVGVGVAVYLIRRK